ncbi:MAG: Holliday junction branch migration protein RuvA [Lachnospiraceae bacterium]|jgi:Holliday junction DNA helicase RuvA|nr:Holliday junction branch migration protein RuvA [Lachnospiraceae bacterium]
MIGFLRGEIAELTEQMAVIDVQGVGYEVWISKKTMAALPKVGSEAKLYTYFHIREDAMRLYGFLTKDDLDFYKQLIGVNGIGPKGALGILEGMTTDDLRLAILSEDVKAISKAPGIGAKTAQRLIFDLKDKISIRDTKEEFPGFLKEGEGASNEAAQALITLGYSQSEAIKAVQKVKEKETMSADAILKAALKQMNF